MSNFGTLSQYDFLYFGMKLHNDGINPMPKNGFDFIALNDIFQGR